MNGEKIRTNPLSDFIDDEIYNLLSTKGFINYKQVRDHTIRKRFRTLRASKVKTTEAIEQILEDYPYLQFESIKKIVYQRNK